MDRRSLWAACSFRKGREAEHNPRLSDPGARCVRRRAWLHIFPFSGPIGADRRRDRSFFNIAGASQFIRGERRQLLDQVGKIMEPLGIVGQLEFQIRGDGTNVRLDLRLRHFDGFLVDQIHCLRPRVCEV